MSNILVKRFRYAFLLPVLHLAIAVPAMFRENLSIWEFVPQAQAVEDHERDHPEQISAAPDDFAWSPCYEYRISPAARLILTADLPAALLVGTSPNECALGAARPIMTRLKYRVRMKSRMILVDCLLFVGIIAQWFLVGRWLDRLAALSKPLRRWIVPNAIIALGGIVMAPTIFGREGVAELINIVAGLVTLVAWLVLLVMFAAVGITSMIRKIHSTHD